MRHTIHCRICDADTAAENILDLINAHTDGTGRFPCSYCGGTDTYIHKTRHAEDGGRGRERWIKGVMPIATTTADPAHAPFVFLTADRPDGDVTGIEFKYFNGGRGEPERSRDGRAPGGGPVLAPAQLLSLVGRLVRSGVVSPTDWRAFATDLATPVAGRVHIS